jgi:hypothetical protein
MITKLAIYPVLGVAIWSFFVVNRCTTPTEAIKSFITLILNKISDHSFEKQTSYAILNNRIETFDCYFIQLYGQLQILQFLGKR